MSLARRIKKLQKQGKQVEVNKYYLLDVSSYNASEWITRFWVGFGIMVIVGFFVFWFGSMIITSNNNSSNIELRRIESERQSQEAIEKAKRKQEYVEACKSSGKAPSDMGDREDLWECV